MPRYLSCPVIAHALQLEYRGHHHSAPLSHHDTCSQEEERAKSQELDKILKANESKMEEQRRKMSEDRLRMLEDQMKIENDKRKLKKIAAKAEKEQILPGLGQ